VTTSEPLLFSEADDSRFLYDATDVTERARMNIVVATDGMLSPHSVTEAVTRFYTPADSVTVFTAVNVPTDFLRGLGDKGVKGAAQIALEAGQTLGAGDKAAERLSAEMPTQSSRPPSDSPVASALAATAGARTEPIVDALRAEGVEAKSQWLSTENKTARTVMAYASSIDAELIVIGSHGHGRFEGLLGSTGTKLVRHAKQAVLVLRNPQDN
jgi:nucleotide-binding universal stress UspA family protein